MTAHVYIHDMEAMDQALLNSATDRPTRPAAPVTASSLGNLEGRFSQKNMLKTPSVASTRSRQERSPPNAGTMAAAPAADRSAPPSTRTTATFSSPDAPKPAPRGIENSPNEEKASKFEELARQAEKAGKPGAAKLHWQIAAKYGSKVAAQQLVKAPVPAELLKN
jgi:hypothetical protein